MEPKILDIAEALKNKVSTEASDAGLFSGMSGISLFYYELGKVSGDKEYFNLAGKYLAEVFEKINTGFNYPTYCSGLAGVGWLLKFYTDEDFLDAEELEVLNDFDTYLHQTMLQYLDSKLYDYLHGAVGIGLYFLSRLPKSDAVKALEMLVDGLDRISVHDKVKKWCWWENSDPNNQNNKIINFSLSHGIASVANFLGRCVKAGIAVEKSRNMLDSTLRYMLENRNSADKESCFPIYLSNSERYCVSRLAWCYGDPGMCTALWQTATITGNSELESICLNAMIQAAKCRNLQEARIFDAGICHGTAGLALIFSRMYKNTKLAIFGEAAEFWREQTIGFAVQKEGIAGYQAWNSKQKEWISLTGLLDGAAGIGLVLLALEENGSQNWDELLLLS